MTDADPRDVVEEALQACVKLQKIGQSRDQVKILACVAQLVDEIRQNHRVIPALQCIADICLSFPEAPTDYRPGRGRGLLHRHEIIARVQNAHSLIPLVADNLTVLMNQAKHYHVDHPSKSPEEVLPSGQYSHVQQVQGRLQFLSFFLKEGQLWLSAAPAGKIWTCLHKNAVYSSDQKLCSEWFSELLRGESDIDPAILQDFFTNYILKMDPDHLTESDFQCFETFFDAVNIKEDKLIKRNGRRVMQDLKLLGHDHLWRVAISSPNNVLTAANAILGELYTSLGPNLKSNRVGIQEDFIASCIGRLKENHEVLAISMKDQQKDVKDSNEYNAIVRILDVLEAYVTECDSAFGDTLVSTPATDMPRNTQSQISLRETVKPWSNLPKISCHPSFLRQLADWGTKLQLADVIGKAENLLESKALNPSPKSVLQPLDTLADDYQKLLLTGTSSDFVFVVSGEEILAHKLVLSTRLPYFEKLFASGMCEAVNSRVSIDDLDANTFKQLLGYIYHAQLPVDLDESPDAYLPYAEKYDMPELKSACVATMIRNINAENVAEFAVMAHLFQCPELKTECFRRLKEWKNSMSDDALELLEAHPKLLMDFIKNT